MSQTYPPDREPGVYSVRPDRTTSTIALVGLGVFAWLASQWAEGVSTDSEAALRLAETAQQVNTRQADQLERLPTYLEQQVTSAISPTQQRVEDLRAQYAGVYTVSAAERDKAVAAQELQRIRAEINANQDAIQQAKGRLDRMDSTLTEINRKVDQLYQAVLGPAARPSTTPYIP